MDPKPLFISILGDIKFNKDFEEKYYSLKENMQKDLLDWCDDCKKGLVLGSVPSKKDYKDLFVFFKKIGGETRAILVKKQNSEFVELILTNHKYYDDTRKKLGYKKNSYYN